MNRQQQIERILDLLGRPDEHRELGCTNLSSLDDARLGDMLQQLERDSLVIAATVEQWLEPISNAAFAINANTTPSEPAEQPLSKGSARHKQENAKQRASGEDDKLQKKLSELSHLPQVGDRFTYQHLYGDLGAIAEVKRTTFERCLTLQNLCIRHSNDHPLLKKIVDQYATTLRSVDENRGLYRLHLEAKNIEYALYSDGVGSFDPDGDQPLDAELVMALQSLLTAHVGLISFFPGIIHLTEELNRYRAQSLAIDSLQTQSRSLVSSGLADQLLESEREFKKYNRLGQRLSFSAVGVTSISNTVVLAVLIGLFRICINVARLFLKAAKHSRSVASTLARFSRNWVE
jgi:hypothetical protein